METTYYVVSNEYVGPNLSQRCNSHTYSITTTPPRTNSSHEIRTDGWLGTTNDWAAYAHGEFQSESDAREAVSKILSNGMRELDCDEPTGIDSDGEPIYDIARFAVGAYEEVNAETSCTWCYESIRSDVDADTTDEKIDELLEEYEASANNFDEPFTLDLNAVKKDMIERRDELRAERDEEAA